MRSTLDKSFFVLLLSIVLEVCLAQNTTRKPPYTHTRIVTHPSTEPFPASDTKRVSNNITKTRIVVSQRTEPFAASTTHRDIAQTQKVASQRSEPFAANTVQSFSSKNNQRRIVSSQSGPFAADTTKSFSNRIDQTRTVTSTTKPFATSIARSFPGNNNQTRVIAMPFANDITKTSKIDQTRTVNSTTSKPFATDTARIFPSNNNPAREVSSQTGPFATDITKSFSNRIDQTRTVTSTTSEPFATNTARIFPSNNNPTRVSSLSSQSKPIVANTAGSFSNSIDQTTRIVVSHRNESFAETTTQNSLNSITQTRIVASHGNEPFAETTTQNSLNKITQTRIVAPHRTDLFATTTTQSSLNSITQTRIATPPKAEFEADTQSSAVITQTTPISRTEPAIVSAAQRSFNVTQPRIPVLPRTGPCVLNDDGMNCTEAGYYETVQCDANGCFCVAAHNGLIAYDTRTDSNRIAPKCSNCHNTLKRIFAAGDPPKNTSIPKCDVSLGNYEPLQCDARQEYCYCVDPVTGRELPNTRKRKEKNQRIKCDNMDFSLDPALSTPEIFQPQERYPVGKESCKLDRDRGRTCNGVKPSIRYYFDYQTFACLAFEYLGCGGNENNYRTSSDCSFDCKLQDLSGCGGMYPAARGTNGQALICGNLFPTIISYPPDPARPSTLPPPRNGPKLNEDGCPKDHKCVMGAFFGFCCSKANEDRWDKAYHPTCPNGRPPYSEMRDGWQETRFGKSCKDRFCPTNYTCHDSYIFSYCC
ncbi:unnamed protein product [Cylicocyclus nassatus]|uniref:Uncharacterized protein n=1 Tax=Cylicocyclus nassatus TaxID=53992 RepID=A0AA36GKE5_CYLNA|nr:unnamed protein product [Cylicocyclus nassatus]